MPLPFGSLEAAVVFTLATAGATVQSTAGFGFALIAAPPLLLIYAPLVPGPLLASSMILTGMISYRERAHIDLSGVAYALMGRVIGTAVAAGFLLIASELLYDLAFAGLVMLGVLLSAAGFHVRPSRVSGLLAGSLSGLMSTISSIGGPPMALLYQREGVARIRGTLAGYFVLGAMLSLVALVAVGRFGWEEAFLALFLAPAMVLGFLFAAPLRNRLSDAAVRPLVLVLSACSAAVVLLRTLL